MRLLGFVVSLMLIGAYPSYAKNDLSKLSPDQLQRVFNNAGMDATYCTLFFKFTVDCLENTPSTDSATLKTFKKARDQLAELMGILNTGAGMNAEGLKARVLDVNDDMRQKTNGQCANLAVLRRQYLDQCIEMHNNPDVRVNYWQRKLYPAL